MLSPALSTARWARLVVANVHSLGQEFLYFKDTHRLPLPEKETVGTSLAVQWLRFRASNAEGTGSITGWGPKIPHAARWG